MTTQPAAATGTASAVTVRRIATTDEYRAAQDVQRRAFRLTDDSYVVPVATMVGAQMHGGLVLGAFQEIDGSERLIGFSFAFLGKVRGRLCLYSQLTAVDPDIQAGGVGTQLKMAQRECARDDGLEIIAWAFDPLQAMNAHLNLNKLGATVASYAEDMYGARSDGLSRGVPSDRLIVEWPAEPDTPPDVPDGNLPQAIRTSVGPDGVLRVQAVDVDLDAPAVLLEIPDEIVKVKEADPAAGTTWHEAVRTAFEAYLGRGYTSRVFLRREEGGRRRCYYLLSRAE